jgi:mannose PTS system EIIA component
LVAIVVITHGRMAEGIIDAAEMIVGEQTQLVPVGLFESEAVEGLIDKIELALSTVRSDEGALLLVDFPGASPFHASARLAMADPSLGVVSGVNLPMLTEILIQREGKTVEELIALAKTSAIQGIKSLDDILNRR